MAVRRPAAITGFGDVRFRIARDDRDASIADFVSEPLIVRRHIAGSDLNITQFLGSLPSQVTYEVWIDAKADYAVLLGYQDGTSRPLTLVDSTTVVPGQTFLRNGTRYREIAEVLLTGVSPPRILVDGTVICELSFELAEGTL